MLIFAERVGERAKERPNERTAAHVRRVSEFLAAQRNDCLASWLTFFVFLARPTGRPSERATQATDRISTLQKKICYDEVLVLPAKGGFRLQQQQLTLAWTFLFASKFDQAGGKKIRLSSQKSCKQDYFRSTWSRFFPFLPSLDRC